MADNRQCYSFFCGRSVGFGGGGGGGNAHLNDAENMRKKAEVQIVSASQWARSGSLVALMEKKVVM